MIHLLLLLAFEPPAKTCFEVDHGSLTGRDLAVADSRFSTLSPDLRLGYAPVPGATRVLSGTELRRIAAANGIQGEFDSMCFQQAMHALTRDRLLSVLTTSLGKEHAVLEIEEFSLFRVPAGELIFPRSGLGKPAGSTGDSPVLWRGFVRYGDSDRFPVWVRLRIRAKERVVRTLVGFKAGQVIGAGQVVEEEVNGFPIFDAVATEAVAVAGKVVRRDLKAGSSIPLDALELVSQDVRRGDKVEVEVNAGPARLRFSARAEAGGVRGETVTVKNEQTGKVFAARIEGKGKVVVLALGEAL